MTDRIREDENAHGPLTPQATSGEDAPVLVSACLLGLACRYDARWLALPGPVSELLGRGRIVPFCPEQAGGLPTPREPASIERGKSGDDVLDGRARVLTASGLDVTEAFLRGAREALAIAHRLGVRKALLKSSSPSCGAGSLRGLGGRLEPGDGVTAALLRRANIEVIALDAPKLPRE